MAEQITNLFEYSQTTFRFAFCKNINDGRGYTSGIIGFTTGTQDAYSVIAKYTQSPGQTNEFAPYLSTLSDLAKQSVQKGGPVDNVAGLSGYCDAWKKASENPIFRRLQIDAQTVIYYEPALKIGAALGLKNPASFGQLYDAAIQMGVEGNNDTISSLVKRVQEPAPINNGSEAQWINAFLAIRKQVLCNPVDPAAKAAWCITIPRVESYEKIVVTYPQLPDVMQVDDNAHSPVGIKCKLDLESSYTSDQEVSSALAMHWIIVIVVGSLLVLTCAGFYVYHRQHKRKLKRRRTGKIVFLQ